MIAIMYKRETVAKLLIDRGADVNASVGVGAESILCCTVQSGNKQMIELLLRSGAAVGPRKLANGSLSRPIIWEALETLDVEIVKMIFEYGADAKSKIGGKSLLHVAVKKGASEIVELLLNLGEGIYTIEKELLLIAVNSKNERIIEMLLQPAWKKNWL